MSISFSSKDIDYIYYHNQSIKITLKHDLNGIKEITMTFKDNDTMLAQMNKFIQNYNLILDDEFLARKYISKL